MYQKKLEEDIRCPLEYGLALFGGKWKSRAICVLAAKKRLRYGALRRELVNITDTVLAATLQELVRDGMVQRTQFEENPPRVEYCLTKKGASIVPILRAICQWAGANCCDARPALTLPQCKKCDYQATGCEQALDVPPASPL